MKKIILVLLVLFCGMGLFAETYTFYTGDRAFFGKSSSEFDNDYNLYPIGLNKDPDDCHSYFTRIQTSAGSNTWFDVELTVFGSNTYCFTYEVTKGTILKLVKVGENDDCRLDRVKKNFLVTDIIPNQITLQEQE